jgi:dodecin
VLVARSIKKSRPSSHADEWCTLMTLVHALPEPPQPRKDQAMAKQQAESVYRIVDVVGVSDKSWEDAGRHAVETAAGSLRDLRVAEVTQMDMKVENGKVTAFRTRVALSFKYEA